MPQLADTLWYMEAVYTVVNRVTRERGTFTTAHDVAMYMWGRDFTRYRIYKNGTLVQWTDGNLRAFEKALEAV